MDCAGIQHDLCSGLTHDQVEQAATFVIGTAMTVMVAFLSFSALYARWRNSRATGVTRSSSPALQYRPARENDPSVQRGVLELASPTLCPRPATPIDYSIGVGIGAGTWLDRVNRQPDKTPHLAVTGPSGSGKTTLVLAVLSDRAGRMVVCTPKAARNDPWGGFPAVRLKSDDMSYEPLGRAIRAVYREMLRRNAQETDASEDWLTLVVDDYSTVIGELPDLRPMMLRMLTLGRSVRIRLVLIDTETNVKAWGIEGRGEARHNLIYIECEEDTHAAKIYRWKERDKPQQLDTSPIQVMAGRAQLRDRAWRPPTPVENEVV